MSHTYTPVGWNPQKKTYTRWMCLGILAFIISYGIGQYVMDSHITIETLIIRATGLSAITLLHLILVIGPLARLDSRFLPLLYNRRHAGVSMFFLALIHGVFCIIQFHALGDTHPLVSVFSSNQHYAEISEFPFQVLGFLGLIILFLMAATSHDFWLHNLSPRVWKILHMHVYVAYVLIILHVVTGALQYESHVVHWILLMGGFIVIAGLHLYTGIREYIRLQSNKNTLIDGGFHLVCSLSDIPDNCAKTVFINNENIAIFKYDNKLSAVHNVCKHQMGPLGEGKIIDGCITCPWHGYQYLPENGQSPPPFTEKVKTYEVQLLNEQVWVNPQPKDEGSFINPAKITQA